MIIWKVSKFVLFSPQNVSDKILQRRQLVIANSQNIQVLRQTLRHLYDPVALRRSPLVSSLGLHPGDESTTSLRLLLTKTIQSMKPSSSLPQSSKNWRIYQILTYRFVEQSTQKQVASELGLSIRQLRRLEVLALEALSEKLDSHKANTQVETQSPSPAPGADQELEFLSKAPVNEMISIKQLIENIVHTIAPLFQSLGVNLDFTPPNIQTTIYGQAVSIRQGIINVLSALAQCVVDGRIGLELQQSDKMVFIRVEARSSVDTSYEANNQLVELIKLGDRLLALSGGGMQMVAPRVQACCLNIKIDLPRSSHKVVLALDDNLDALRLIERYLTGSLYRLYSLQDPSGLISMAESVLPDVILLDVMLPGVDGWEVLERLREHPQLQKIPVVVSTILPQEPLAMALGAAAFIQKPVGQEVLLQTLDHLLTRPREKELS